MPLESAGSVNQTHKDLLLKSSSLCVMRVMIYPWMGTAVKLYIDVITRGDLS